MINLGIQTHSRKSIEQSFEIMAHTLLTDYQLQINNCRYRLIDIEFYYYAENICEDIYAHKHVAQLQSGKWYFHGSGIDLTFGDGTNHGGMLIRAMAEVSPTASAENRFILNAIHGPLNVKTEIASRLHGAFDPTPNHFYLRDVSADKIAAGMKDPDHIIKTRRIGLNPGNDDSSKFFYDAKYRFVIFPSLRLKDKTMIARDMQAQFPGMSTTEINKALGSKFL
jgi:hypothetical protein